MNVTTGLATFIVMIVVLIGLLIYNQTEDSSPSTSSTDSSEVQTFTLSDIAEHNESDDCWTTISGGVYDITDYVPNHPGGDEILRACGTDGTLLFTTRTTEDGEAIGSGTPHSASASSRLQSYRIGNLAE